MTLAMPTKPTPKAAIWIMILIGPFLMLSAIGLAILLYAVLPAPSRPLPGWLPVLLLDLALIGAVGFANGLYARSTGRQSPVLRGITLVCGAGFIGICLATLH